MQEALPNPFRQPILPRAGVGLKAEHYRTILEMVPDTGFFEVHAENYMGAGGPPHRYLAAIREHYPLSLHGVGLSIGADRPLDREHLARLDQLIDRYAPALFSEHLAWSSHDAGFLNDLLPLPYTNETLARTVEHIDQVQAFLGRQMLLENPSTYLAFAESTWSETAFITEIVRRTGCGLLLDVNNVHVACTNQHWDPIGYLDAYPLPHVQEIHLAGFAPDADEKGAPLLIDAHDRPVAETVWHLFEQVIERTGPLPTLIEWDADIPNWPLLEAEAAKADRVMAAASHSVRLPAASETLHPIRTYAAKRSAFGAGTWDMPVSLLSPDMTTIEPHKQSPKHLDEHRSASAAEGPAAIDAVGHHTPSRGAPEQSSFPDAPAKHQARFARAILDPQEPVPDGLIDPRGRPSARRFAVYRNNVIVGLIEALKTAYPVTHRLVGGEFFTEMARRHAMAEPPASPIMLDYGGGFPAFIASFEPAAALPYLADVARLERAWVEAYHAAEASPLAPSALGQVPPDDAAALRLVFHPSVRIVRSDFPIMAIWHANVDGTPTEPIELDDGGEDVLVARPEAGVALHRLPPGAAAFIQALQSDVPILDAAAEGTRASSHFDLSIMLRGVIEANLIIGHRATPLGAEAAA